jgi:uncharacterized protein YjbJ (UPF0337 family)
MNTSRIETAARETAGRVQETIGKAAGDIETEARGAINRGYGQVQQLDDAVRQQPLLSAAIAMGIGFILGRLTAR